MNQNRMMQQMWAIIGAFMTLFYLGVGMYFMTASYLNVEKFLRVLVGSTFVVYGIYRGFTTWSKVKEAFFSNGENEDDEEEEDPRDSYRHRYL